MAIAGLSVKSGAKGRASAHAAYVAREGQYARYTELGEVLEAAGHGNLPAWCNDQPQTFWAASDAHERANGTSYREMQIGLPRELDAAQRASLVKDFIAQEIGDTHAYQFAIHVPTASDGLENPHVHLMFSERRNDEHERGSDTYFKRYNPKFPERGGARKYFGTNPHDRKGVSERRDELKDLRGRWEVECNVALERAGVEQRIDMRSYSDRGLDIEPEPKQLPSEWRDGGREAMIAFRAAREAELEVRRNPEVIIDRVSARKGMFTRQDLYRELNKVVENVERFGEIKAVLDSHPSLVPMQLSENEVDGASSQRLTTKAVLESEYSIRGLGDSLVEDRGFGLSDSVVEKAIAALPFELGAEQISAIKHVSDEKGLALVSGVAGAGKSTMLGVVREAYEQSGYRVSGMALAGKAADELSQSSGIESRTIASWLYRFDQGQIELGKKDVLVLDEAGMVHNCTMERVLEAANSTGAKVVLVGDAEQLQPIELGTPFLSLSEEHAPAAIGEVRRQSEAWQRQATMDLASQNGGRALAAYTKAGCVHDGLEGLDKALVSTLVTNYLDGGKGRESDTKIVLAHRKVDVAMLNESIRDERKARGELIDARVVGEGENKIELAVGDRVVFTKNDRQVGVLNGQFGDVVALSGDGVSVKRDDGSVVSFSTAEYSELQHGYASTVHKSQGMTVDRAMVWGSASLDRHIGYVAMSRHRDRLDVYQPHSATRVRSLESCLSRSNRVASVGTVIERAGLGLSEGDDGRVRLAPCHPTLGDVDQASDLLVQDKAMREAARDEQRQEFEEVQSHLVLQRDEAKRLFDEHQANEPPNKGLKVLTPSGHRAHLQWSNERGPLKRDFIQAQDKLKRLYQQQRQIETAKPWNDTRLAGVDQAREVITASKVRQSEQEKVRSFYKLEKKLASPLNRSDRTRATRQLQDTVKRFGYRRDTGRLPDRLKTAVKAQKEHSRSHDRGGLSR